MGSSTFDMPEVAAALKLLQTTMAVAPVVGPSEFDCFMEDLMKTDEMSSTEIDDLPPLPAVTQRPDKRSLRVSGF